MRANIEATRGAVFAERAMMLLAAAIGRDAAHTLVEKAAKQSAAEGRHLAEALAEIPEVTKILDTQTLRELETPQAYLGVTEELRKRLRFAKKKG
jgi:3-carboxy-cis,cis-muconate cycloisomerase